MKKTIILLASLILLVTSGFAAEKRSKTNFSVSYAHEFRNKAASNYSETSYGNAIRLHVSNEGFVNMNAIVSLVLPYKDNINYLNGEMGKIKGKQPFAVSIIGGPSINLPLCDYLNAFGTIGLKASIEIVNTKTSKEERKDMMTGLGIGGSFGFKILPNKPINVLLGCDLYSDFYRAGTVIPGYVPSVSVAYSPFVGISFTL